MKISIVMAYHNRRKLLMKTLDSIRFSEHKNIETIIVDDCSDDEHKIKDLEKRYSDIKVKVIELKNRNRWYINPCVPYNIGFKEADGDVVMIKNPECFHYQDVLKYTADKLKENDYISFGCIQANEKQTDQIFRGDYIRDVFAPIDIDNAVGNIDGQWYTHNIHRIDGYHFTSVIYRKHLIEMGGFDERYAMGMDMDDVEFIYRVKLKGLNFKIVNNPLVIHLCHGYTTYDKRLHDINQSIYDNVTTKEKKLES